MASDASPWKLGGLSVIELGRRVWGEMSEDRVTTHAAALSYYFLFSLFPAMLFFTALLGYLPLGNLMETLMGYARQVLPPQSAAMLEKTLGEVLTNRRGGLLSVGALVALWSASSGMVSVMQALNVAYDVEDPRPWWQQRLVALALTVGFALFLTAALAFMVFGPQLGEALGNWLGFGGLFTALWNIVGIPVAVLLVVLGTALVYYLAPAVEQRWRWITPGSLVAVVLWVVASVALRLYVTHFGNYNATYGSIGAVILLLLWLYITGVVLLLGAEVNAVIEHAAGRRGQPGAKQPGQRAA